MRSDGPIPDGWAMRALGELVGIFDGPHSTPQKTEDGPVFLGISNLDNGRLELSDVAHLCEEDFGKWTRRITPRPGDLVFSYETRLGEAALIPEGLRCCLGRRMGLLRARSTQVVPRYLLYAYLGPDFQRVIRNRTVPGSTVNRIPLKEMGTFPIPLPPRDEQERIAAVLGALDDKIDSNRRLGGLLEQLVATIFRARFVDFVGVEEFEQSEIGRIPRGWSVGTLAEITRLEKKSTQPAESPDQVFEHFSIPAFDEGGEPKLAAGATLLSSKTQLPDGDCILLSKLNLQRSWRVWWPRPSGRGLAVCSPEFLALLPHDHVPPTYLFALLSSDDRLRTEILMHVGGTTGSRQRVKPREVLASRVLVPAEAAMRVWDTVARPFHEQAHGLRAESRSLASARDALLPKLVSGEIRVPDTGDPDEVIEPAAERTAA